MNRVVTTAISALIVLLCAGCGSSLRVPAHIASDRYLLPNGWTLSPAGKPVGVGDLPLNMVVTPDSRSIIVTNNGAGDQTLTIVDVATWTVRQSLPVSKSWLGLTLFNTGTQLAVSGGNDNRVRLYTLTDGRAVLSDSIVVGEPWPTQKIWIAGIGVDDETHTMYIAAKNNDSLYFADLQTKRITGAIQLAGTPYTCLVSHSRPVVYVSVWGKSAIAVIDRATRKQVTLISVGDHPNDMVESPDGARLFVSNANTNSVSVIDVASGRISETLTSALYPGAPAGSTPNSVALSSDGSRLYVANADNNCLAVFDVSRPGSARSLGFVPTGWYPTCVRLLPSTGEVIVAEGKGRVSKPNPLGPNPEKSRRSEEYIGWLFPGSLARIAPPTTEDLATYSRQVYANTPYTTAKRDHPGTDPSNPIPAIVGGRSPIKHVFYIIKENRTYDQVFGDIASGNGDPSLCIFPDSVTPNLHALVRQFVLLDNLYADAEVSADGHNWSMGAYATDYTEKVWPTSYGGRGGDYEFQGGYPAVFPTAGYLWDNAQRSGVTYRSYGEFTSSDDSPASKTVAEIAGLVGHVAPDYRGWDLEYSDEKRVQDWIRELEVYERNDSLPQLNIIALPNDHTEGTRKGALTPRAFLAQNDLALGQFIERLSRSKFWKESAVFVIEDDAQSGADHVDAHRTEALVISPYTKRGFVDHEMYSTSSMIRTMELILGMPALSQYDAAATPFYASFSVTPDMSGYVCRPANVNLQERNRPGMYGQSESEEMDFSHPDRAPDRLLNDVIWRAMRSPDANIPAPVRSAFVTAHSTEDGDTD